MENQSSLSEGNFALPSQRSSSSEDFKQPGSLLPIQKSPQFVNYTHGISPLKLTDRRNLVAREQYNSSEQSEQEVSENSGLAEEYAADCSKPTVKAEDTYLPQQQISAHELTVDREQSITLLGIQMTPGGDRAIVVESDSDKPADVQTFMRRASLEEAAEEVSAPESSLTKLQFKGPMNQSCCRDCTRLD